MGAAMISIGADIRKVLETMAAAVVVAGLTESWLFYE